MVVRTFPERRRGSSLVGSTSYNYPAAQRRGNAMAVVVSPFELSGNNPEYRWAERDQTDPAGRYRAGVSGDIFYLARSEAAAWGNTFGSASDFNFLAYDRTNKKLLFNALEDDSWFIELLSGVAGTPGTNAGVYVQAHATAPYVDIRTGNAGGGSLVSRLIVRGGTGSPDIDVASAQVDLDGNVLKGLAVVRGNGTANVQIVGNKAATDATARRIALYVLDPATDTEYIVANAVPDAAVPKFTMAAPDDAPSTSELDADHITFGYTKATDTLTVYVNEAGVIKSLALGVLV